MTFCEFRHQTESKQTNNKVDPNLMKSYISDHESTQNTAEQHQLGSSMIKGEDKNTSSLTRK